MHNPIDIFRLAAMFIPRMSAKPTSRPRRISVWLDDATSSALDGYRKAGGMSVSEAVRVVLALGIASETSPEGDSSEASARDGAFRKAAFREGVFRGAAIFKKAIATATADAMRELEEGGTS